MYTKQLAFWMELRTLCLSELALTMITICAYVLRIYLYDANLVSVPDGEVGVEVYLDEDSEYVATLTCGSCVAMLLPVGLRMLCWKRRRWSGLVLVAMKVLSSMLCTWFGVLLCLVTSQLDFETFLDWVVWTLIGTLCALEFAATFVVCSVHKDYRLFLSFEKYTMSTKLKESEDKMKPDGEMGRNQDYDLSAVKETVNRARQNAQQKMDPRIYGVQSAVPGATRYQQIGVSPVDEPNLFDTKKKE